MDTALERILQETEEGSAEAQVDPVVLVLWHCVACLLVPTHVNKDLLAPQMGAEGA